MFGAEWRFYSREVLPSLPQIFMTVWGTDLPWRESESM